MKAVFVLWALLCASFVYAEDSIFFMGEQGVEQCLDFTVDTGIQGTYKLKSAPNWFTLTEDGHACASDLSQAGKYKAEISVKPKIGSALAVGVKIEIQKPALNMKFSGKMRQAFSVDLEKKTGLKGQYYFISSNPNWLNLSDDGLLEGTPSAGGKRLVSIEVVGNESRKIHAKIEIEWEDTTNNRLSLGNSFTSVIDDEGVKAWGYNGYQQTSVPSTLSSPVQVSAGLNHMCAIDDNGVQCWGYNAQNQTTVPTLNAPVIIDTTSDHTCAIDDDGLKCWGRNYDKQCDVPNTLSNPVRVATGYVHTCAIDDNGVTCWGNNSYDQLKVPSLSNPVYIDAGNYHTCAIDDNGVQCWGYNSYQQSTPPSLSNPVSLGLGAYHSCAIDDNGLQCWGYNYYKQIDVPSLTGVAEVDAGGSHTCALHDGGVSCWGYNGSGQTTVPSNVVFNRFVTGLLGLEN